MVAIVLLTQDKNGNLYDQDGHLRNATDFIGKIVSAYNSLNTRIETLGTQVRKLEMQLVQTGDTIKRQEALAREVGVKKAKHHVNAIIDDDFWQVVRHEKLGEGDFEVESSMCFGGSQWCRPMSKDTHRSTEHDEDRSTDYSRHRSTLSTESIDRQTDIDRPPSPPIDRRAPLTYRVRLPSIDNDRINALRPPPKPSANPPELTTNPSDTTPEPMQVDEVTEGRRLRKRKEKIPKNLKREANEKEMDAQEKLGDELKTLVDDTYQPLERSYNKLFRSMAEMKTEIGSMQHSLEKESTTSPSIDADKATSIDVKPQTSQIPAEPQCLQDLDTIRKKDPQPATSIDICTITSIDSKFASMEDRLGGLDSQAVATEGNQSHSKATRISTPDISIDRHARSKSIDITAPATIDRHLVTSIDTTSTPDDEQLIQNKMESMHEELNELSAYAYDKIGWHQFRIEDILERLQNILNAIHKIDERWTRNDEAIRSFIAAWSRMCRDEEWESSDVHRYASITAGVSMSIDVDISSTVDMVIIIVVGVKIAFRSLKDISSELTIRGRYAEEAIDRCTPSAINRYRREASTIEYYDRSMYIMYHRSVSRRGTRDLVPADFKPKASPNYKITPDEF
uniref:Uncharacterized protein n=1 Tax=Brassica campestris TaxID=3711 RepID=M4EH15_BRACM